TILKPAKSRRTNFDIEMLKAAGTAYVMATGHPLAKKAADYVVESPLPVMQGLL
ncbi:MAG: hypothetical protein EGR13_11275, partial [Coprococcus comes]|nr:hypothetical protein [Coprococcus comes]